VLERKKDSKSRIFVSKTNKFKLYEALAQVFNFFTIKLNFDFIAIKLNLCSLKLRETDATSVRAPTLAILQEELHKETETLRIQNKDLIPHAYYEGYLGTLENTLNHGHETDLLLNEKITRRQFHQTWEQTRKSQGF